jgi:hypothetical protein
MAGIGIGITFGAIILFSILGLLLQKRKKRHTAPSQPQPSYEEKREAYDQYPPIELYGTADPVELYTQNQDSASPVVLDATQ